MKPNPTDLFVQDMNAWHSGVIGKQTVVALKKNNFDAHYFDSRNDLLALISGLIAPDMQVAFGGSQTVKQLNIPELVLEKGAKILDHNAEGLTAEQKLEVMRQQQVCDLFICSSNAITLQGELFNIDGYGNRVAAMAFGPRKVLVIAGVNKICANEEAAWIRLKTVASPINFKRLNRPNPCTVTGTCMNCNLSSRGCNIYVATRKKSPLVDMSVLLLNEDLGF